MRAVLFPLTWTAGAAAIVVGEATMTVGTIGELQVQHGPASTGGLFRQDEGARRCRWNLWDWSRWRPVVSPSV